MRILISIPCLYGAEFVTESINSVVYEQNVDLLIIDNGADAATKHAIGVFKSLPNVYVIENEENVYVNKAWQQAIDYFLESKKYSHLVLMNSDLIMQSRWAEVVFNRLYENPDEIIVPILTDDKNFTESKTQNSNLNNSQQVEAPIGVFIMMNKEQAKIVTPLPFDCCKVWFGDSWIYSILRAKGYKIYVPCNLFAYHLYSATLKQVEGISEIIEQDKISWENICKKRMEEIING